MSTTSKQLLEASLANWDSRAEKQEEKQKKPLLSTVLERSAQEARDYLQKEVVEVANRNKTFKKLTDRMKKEHGQGKYGVVFHLEGALQTGIFYKTREEIEELTGKHLENAEPMFKQMQNDPEQLLLMIYDPTHIEQYPHVVLHLLERISFNKQQQ